MPTECSPRRCSILHRSKGVAVVADFDGGAITSDAGALLLGATDRAIGLVDRFAACFTDGRAPELVEHEVATLVGQRVFGLALGYEDLNDHDQLRHDPVMAVLAGKLDGAARGLRAAGRQEHAEPAGAEPAGADPLPQDRATTRRRSSGCSWSCSSTRTSGRRKQIIARPRCHRRSAARPSGGPVLPRLLRLLLLPAALHLLRPAPAGGQAAPLQHRWRRPARSRRWRASSRQIRARWPRVRIVLRADCGFAREALMAWCEANRVDYVFGLARNARLVAEIAGRAGAGRGGEPSAPAGRRAASRTSVDDARQLEPPAPGHRQGGMDQGRGQSALRRHLAQAAKRPKARRLYEELYCARGEMENRIKECQLDLFADRTSSRDHARQPAAPVVRLDGLRAALRACAASALPDTQFATATCGTIRLKLLKIGALVRRRRRGSTSPWPRAARGSDVDWPTYGSPSPHADTTRQRTVDTVPPRLRRCPDPRRRSAAAWRGSAAVVPSA